MKKQQNKVHMINISLCLIGTLLIAIAVNSFVIPGNLGEGGSIAVSYTHLTLPTICSV